MFIEFENTNKNIRSSVQKNNNPDGTKRWYFHEQEALIWKEGSKYPDKFTLTQIFDNDENKANNLPAFPVGRYVLTDEAYSIDRNGNVRVNFAKLKPLVKQAVAA